MRLASPVYMEKNRKRLLLLHSDTMITNDVQIRRLKEAGIRSVEIDTEGGSDTILSLLDQKKWEEVSKDKKDALANEAIIARHSNNFISSITNIISNHLTSRVLIREDIVASLMKDIILFVENHVDILIAMNRLKGITDYTFSHSVNTCILCVSVSTSLRLNYTDIKRFGSGVLLADLGMTNYPSRMTLRPSGLSRSEIEEIKKHPMYTVEFLKKNGIDDPLINMVITQHHERFDGTGYPFGIKGDDIHPISKLFAIADVYAAMTSPRPHRQGIPPHLVNAEILRLSGTAFDPKIANIFIKHIGAFPVGNMVELTSGKLALVAEQNRKDPLRPTVIIFHAKKKIQPSDKTSPEDPGIFIARGNWKLVDLSKDRGVYGKIKRGLDHRQYHMNPEYYLSQV